jgi:hypothetical protein
MRDFVCTFFCEEIAWSDVYSAYTIEFEADIFSLCVSYLDPFTDFFTFFFFLPLNISSVFSYFSSSSFIQLPQMSIHSLRERMNDGNLES